MASTSPELLLRAVARADGSFGDLYTAPIKGTRPRGADAPTDAALARELDADPKERAELTMILDVERHDLGRVAETGSVRLLWGPSVVTHRTVHHRAALLTARARGGRLARGGAGVGGPERERDRGAEAAGDGGDRLAGAGPAGALHGRDRVRGVRRERDALDGHPDGGARGEGRGVLDGRGDRRGLGPSREVEETRWKARQLLEVARGPLTSGRGSRRP